MPDFSNLYNATVDDKGRIVLPAAYKRELNNSFDWVFAVEKDPYENCLNLYPDSAWEKRVAYIKATLNPNDPRQSRFLDRFYQSFAKLSVAENGRMNIPNSFLQKASIVKDVVFTGQGDRIRLWSKPEYDKAMLPDEEYTQMFHEFLGGSLNPES